MKSRSQEKETDEISSKVTFFKKSQLAYVYPSAYTLGLQFPGKQKIVESF